MILRSVEDAKINYFNADASGDRADLYSGEC